VALELSQAITSQVASRDFIYHQEVAGLMKNIGLEMTQISSQPDREYSKSKIQIGKAHAADDLNVIFGSGPLGLAVMRELLLRGKQVRMIDRTGKAQIPDGVERMVGDAFQVDFTRKACQNAAVVYQCAQPATGIWLERFAPLNAAILDGAAAKGAKFIYGDNLLVYGAVDGPIHEGMANKPQTRKGQVRARVSEAVLTAHRSGRVRAAIGRGSDFFGPNVLDALLGEKFIRTLLQGKTVPMLGDPEMPHTFTYIMDFGKALVELGEREEASGQIWHVPNASTLTQRQLVELFFKEAGIPPKNHSIGRGLLSFKSLFSPDAREKIAVLYQFEKPFIIDSGKFERAFGITATPLAEAVRRTVLWFREYLK
jgi:nucleoside-diphosphate-sugar epimerase